ncbi:MAG: hypothetical protein GX174_05880 [Lentisphaerae bacterium]|jgi:hypothetical protein|nr:hypothetical protein [Lentisphaerota bacterium]
MKKADRKGSALLIVIGIVLLISLATAALSYHASHQMHTSKVTREQLKARLIAESGLNKAFHEIRQDFDQVHSYSDTAEFGDGAFAVTNAPLYGPDGSVLEDRAQLISHGTCGGVGKAVVKIDVERRSSTTSPDGELARRFFDLIYNLAVDGPLTLTGNFKANVDRIHANGNVVLQKGSVTDTTTVSGTGSVTWKNKKGGEAILLDHQSPVELLAQALFDAIQTLIDYATSNGQVYDSASQLPAAPEGGVAYCKGDGRGWDGVGKGCYIFAGDGNFQGNKFDLESVNGYPALIVLGVNETKVNGGKIKGAFIVPNGYVKLNGNAEFHGAILVGQYMTGTGTADIYAGDGKGFYLPSGEITTTEEVVITAWH